MKTLSALVCAIAVSVASVSVLAHQETVKGKVTAIEKASVRVNVIDPKTKKTRPATFKIDKATKVLRGDAVVAFASANIRKGENIAVTIDHDEDAELAIVVRLDAAKK
jgi:ribosomal protein S1